MDEDNPKITSDMLRAGASKMFELMGASGDECYELVAREVFKAMFAQYRILSGRLGLQTDLKNDENC